MKLARFSLGNLVLTIWLASPFCLPARATCLILLTSPDFIVLGADGKGVILNSLRQRKEPPTMTIEKVLLVKNRIAVAQCGTEEMTDTHSVLYYTFPSFIKELGDSAPADITVKQFVDLIEGKLPGMFDPFKHSLALGTVKPENLPQPSDSLFHMIIAGFENGHPVAYLIYLPIDWRRLQVEAPVVTRQYPNTTKNISAAVCGGEHGVETLWDHVDNPLVDEQAQKHPAEYHALVEDKPLPLDGMLRLDKSMLDVDVKASPDKVGYPLTIFTISRTSVERHRYETP